MTAANFFFVFVASFIVSANAIDEVVLNSSISGCGRLTVCPKETVLFECFVVGESLAWILPDLSLHQSFNQSNNTEINVVQNFGPASVWLSNNKQLKSTLVLLYSPGLNNVEVQCNSPTAFRNITYVLAEPPDIPQLSEPKFVGQSKDSIQYMIEWSEQNKADLDFHEVNVNGKKTKSFVSSNDNKIIISTEVGVETRVSVVAVNKCGGRSSPAEKSLKPVKQTSSNIIIYIVTTLAIVFCMISLLLLLVILVFVYQKLKMNKKHYQSSKNEGFPLLAQKESNQDSS